MPLCNNRPEGFLSSSTIYPGAPSQCYIDIVLVPLPTWILIFTLLIAFTIIRTRTLGNYDRHASRRPCRGILTWFYYFCIAVIVGMEALELARLVAADLGVGLIPVLYVGVVIAGLARAAQNGLLGEAVRSRFNGGSDGGPGLYCRWWEGVTIPNLLFWGLSAVFTWVKVGTLGRMAFDYGQVYARIGSHYPVADQFTDLVVIAAFYMILFGLEFAVARGGRSRKTG